jgi:hypothetical protein
MFPITRQHTFHPMRVRDFLREMIFVLMLVSIEDYREKAGKSFKIFSRYGPGQSIPHSWGLTPPFG